jgi:hypothetical protein
MHISQMQCSCIVTLSICSVCDLRAQNLYNSTNHTSYARDSVKPRTVLTTVKEIVSERSADPSLLCQYCLFEVCECQPDKVCLIVNLFQIACTSSLRDDRHNQLARLRAYTMLLPAAMIQAMQCTNFTATDII